MKLDRSREARQIAASHLQQVNGRMYRHARREKQFRTQNREQTTQETLEFTKFLFPWRPRLKNE